MLKNINSIYFLGIGGIGMSALAQWLHLKKFKIQGWDDNLKTPLINKLIRKGFKIHDRSKKNQFLIDGKNLNKENTIVVYTPAISSSHNIFRYFKSKGFKLYKRSELLEFISKDYTVIAIAGTHGKTTISMILLHILKSSGINCNAFLGGVSKNYNSNFMMGDSDIMIIEADEYDKSFLKLTPTISLVSSLDKDHGDIYEDYGSMINAYQEFIKKTKKNVVGNKKLNNSNIDYTYSGKTSSDFYASSISYNNNMLEFKINFLNKSKINSSLAFGSLYNVENAVGAAALAFLVGISPIKIGKAIASFEGVNRRFEYHVNKENFIFIDDYAHHPEELRSLIETIRVLYKNLELFLIFQPHLFSRTKEFQNEFAEVLSLVDKLILLDIYPAREKNLSDIHSRKVFQKIKLKKKWYVSNKEILSNKKTYLKSILRQECPQILITAGAGDVYKLIPVIKSIVI